jgi:hypothetical protein
VVNEGIDVDNALASDEGDAVLVSKEVDGSNKKLVV